MRDQDQFVLVGTFWAPEQFDLYPKPVDALVMGEKGDRLRVYMVVGKPLSVLRKRYCYLIHSVWYVAGRFGQPDVRELYTPVQVELLAVELKVFLAIGTIVLVRYRQTFVYIDEPDRTLFFNEIHPSQIAACFYLVTSFDPPLKVKTRVVYLGKIRAIGRVEYPYLRRHRSLPKQRELVLVELYGPEEFIACGRVETQLVGRHVLHKVRVLAVLKSCRIAVQHVHQRSLVAERWVGIEV